MAGSSRSSVRRTAATSAAAATPAPAPAAAKTRGTRGAAAAARGAAAAAATPAPPAVKAVSARPRRRSSVAPAAAAEHAEDVSPASGGTPAPDTPDAAMADAAASLPAAAGGGALTSYELEREANIRRNLERMAALNLPVLAQTVAPAAAAAAAAAAERPRGLSTRRRKAAAEALPPRKSLRGQGLAPDGVTAAGIDAELKDGSVVLAGGGGTVLFASPPRATRPEGTLAFASLRGGADSDASFLGTLRGAPVAAPNARPRTSALARSVLAQARVAKVCPKGVTHLDFQRRDDALLLAAGDKEGNVGLWRADAPESAALDAADEDEEDDAGDPWFCAFRPHAQYVSGLRWTAAGASRLLTCSYDGSLRCLDPHAGAWLELHASGDGDEYSAFDATPDGGALYVADNRGGVRLLDARAGTAAAAPLRLHEKRINTLQLEPGAGALLATACGDAHVCVWDVRALGGAGGRAPQPLASLAHGKSCQSAFFAPDGSTRLLSTSYDDTLTVWHGFGSGAAPEALTRVRHDNQTGRWVIPFRAVWTPASDALLVGSMKRESEVIDAATGRHCAKLAHAELMTAIPSRHACHYQRTAMAAATASGRVHVWEPQQAA
jgi:hypothetical protein